MKNSDPLKPRARRRARGFSFPEVLFAVVILGIGLILLAGMLPVGVKVVQETVDRQQADTVAKAGTTYVSAVAPTASLDSTDGAMRFSSELWTQVRGNAIGAADQRYAWVPFYKRSGSSAPVEIVVVGLRSRGRDAFKPEVDLPLAQTGGVLSAKGIRFNLIKDDARQLDLIEVIPNTVSNFHLAVATGVLVIVAADARGVGGDVYRVGNERPDIGAWTWEIAPGQTVTAASSRPIRGIVIGRSPRNPDLPFDAVSNPFSGAAQELTYARATIDMP